MFMFIVYSGVNKKKSFFLEILWEIAGQTANKYMVLNLFG